MTSPATRPDEPLLGLADDARRLLTAWRPVDEAEAFAVDLGRRLLDASPAAVLRHNVGTGHLTVSVVVVHDDGVLLTRHPKFGRWMQLGGHLEPEDVDVCAAAVREAREESGVADLRLDPVPLGIGAFPDIPCPAGRSSWHVDVRYLAHAPHRDVIISDESEDLDWYPLHTLPDPHDADLDLLATQARVRLNI